MNIGEAEGRRARQAGRQGEGGLFHAKHHHCGSARKKEEMYIVHIGRFARGSSCILLPFQFHLVSSLDDGGSQRKGEIILRLIFCELLLDRGIDLKVEG